jgi:hypothetical protein
LQTYGYAPCATEDDAGPCYWDAQTMGNGGGESYVVHAGGIVEYSSAEVATLAETGAGDPAYLIASAALLVFAGAIALFGRRA